LSFFRRYAGRPYQVSSAWQGDASVAGHPVCFCPLFFLIVFAVLPVSRWHLCDRRAVIWSASSNPISICCLLPADLPLWGQGDDVRAGKASGSGEPKQGHENSANLIITFQIVVATCFPRTSTTCRGHTTARNSITPPPPSLVHCHSRGRLLAPRAGARASKPVELADVYAPTFS
jgi:hypothetical protein